MSRYAIAYDASADAVRRRIRSICRKYGARQQYSLFEVRLSPTERAKLVDELAQVVNGDDVEQVHIRIYSVGPKSDDIDIPEAAGADTEAENIV